MPRVPTAPAPSRSVSKGMHGQRAEASNELVCGNISCCSETWSPPISILAPRRFFCEIGWRGRCVFLSANYTFGGLYTFLARLFQSVGNASESQVPTEIPAKTDGALLGSFVTWIFFFFFFSILRRMGKNKAQAPTLPRIRYKSCFGLTHAPVATAARANLDKYHVILNVSTY